jgi:hypothetical protein
MADRFGYLGRHVGVNDQTDNRSLCSPDVENARTSVCAVESRWKQPDGFLEVLERTLLGAAARGNIELASMRHVCSALFEDLGGELNLHTSMVGDEGREV